MTETTKKALILASGYFLTENFPNDFDKWEDEDYDIFIENNMWEPLEGEELNEIYAQIECLASKFEEVAKEGLK